MNWNKKIRETVKNKYAGKCAYCGCKLPVNWQIDHIKPIYQKGSSDLENLNPACFACNNYKNGNGIEAFRMMLKNMLNDNPGYLFVSKSKMDLAIHYGSIIFWEWDGKFHFEKVQCID